MPKAKGDKVKVLVDIVDRDAFFADPNKPGKTKISINADTTRIAASDELGGNIFVEDVVGGDRVVVPLAQGEWQ